MNFLQSKLLCGILALCLAVSLSSSASSETMYAMGRSGNNSTLITVTPSPFSFSVVGTSSAGRFSGLAYHRGTATLYANSGFAGSDPNSFFTIHPGSGAATLVGPIGADGVGFGPVTADLAIDNGGTIYATDFDDLYSINPATGLGTKIGSHVNSFDIEGIAVDPTTDIMYGIDYNDREVYTINKATGEATLIGTLTGPVNDGSLTGLGIDKNGTVYSSRGQGNGSIYELDLVNFTSTLVGQYPGGSVSDITFIPEPSCLLLGMIGITSLGCLRRRP